MKIADLLQSLSDEPVRYVLVGGLAVQLHGFLRATFDIDLVLAMDDENLARFIAVARRYGLAPAIPVPIESLANATQIDAWHREKGMLAFSLREPQAGGSVVDVVVRPDVPFDVLMKNAVVGELFGRRVPVAAIDDLLLMKRASQIAPRINSISWRWKRSNAEKIPMSEIETRPRPVIPEDLMRSRLAQSEQMREFFVEMWLQNPALAKRAGRRVQDLLSPGCSPDRADH